MKKLRLLIRSGRGLPSDVHWVMELYLVRVRQTRLDLEEPSLLVVVVLDSRELRGRIRMATMMPSSATEASLAVDVEDVGSLGTDMVPVLCAFVQDDKCCWLVMLPAL